jgi:hypothetical protein
MFNVARLSIVMWHSSWQLSIFCCTGSFLLTWRGREWQCRHILAQAGEVLRYKPGGDGSRHDRSDNLHCKYSGQKHFTSAQKTVILSLTCLFGPTMCQCYEIVCGHTKDIALCFWADKTGVEITYVSWMLCIVYCYYILYIYYIFNCCVYYYVIYIYYFNILLFYLLL